MASFLPDGSSMLCCSWKLPFGHLDLLRGRATRERVGTVDVLELRVAHRKNIRLLQYQLLSVCRWYPALHCGTVVGRHIEAAQVRRGGESLVPRQWAAAQCRQDRGYCIRHTTAARQAFDRHMSEDRWCGCGDRGQSQAAGCHLGLDSDNGQAGERRRQGMQFPYPCLATCALQLDARSSTNNLDRTRHLQVGLLQLPAVRHIWVEPQQAAASSERFGSGGPASTLEMPCSPFAAGSALTPHLTTNQVQGRPDDLQSTPLEGTKLPLFHAPRLHSYSFVEIRRTASSGITEILQCQGLASFQKLSTGGLEQSVSEHSLCNFTRELQKTVGNNFLRKLNLWRLHLSAANLFFFRASESSSRVKACTLIQ